MKEEKYEREKEKGREKRAWKNIPLPSLLIFLSVCVCVEETQLVPFFFSAVYVFSSSEQRAIVARALDRGRERALAYAPLPGHEDEAPALESVDQRIP